MRRTREVKAETHDAIVAQASRLFREHGVEGTSVGHVMAQAGLTHGGFYRHFETKDALVAAAIQATFEAITQTLEDRAAAVGKPAAAQEYLAYYLSDAHVANPGVGCPVPVLAGEIGRGGPTLKAEFATGFNHSLSALAEGLPGGKPEATRALAMRIGAILIARASDDATARAVLDACRAS